MPIDPLREELISLSEASSVFPARRRGKKPRISCVYRWTTAGCRGVVLETVQAGGSRATSREAVGRFLTALTTGSATGGTATAAPEVAAPVAVDYPALNEARRYLRSNRSGTHR